MIGDGPSFPITQSVAALEYLEEFFPDKCPLLPPRSKPLERAKVRVLANIITSDLQPPTNRRVGKAAEALGGNADVWKQHFTTLGLQAYERMLIKTTGRYSVGDSVSMADVCLMPAMWNAEKGDVDLEKLPAAMRVHRELSKLEAVKKAYWTAQADYPIDGP